MPGSVQSLLDGLSSWRLLHFPRHCRVPKKHVEAGFRLGQWLGYQRHRKNTLSEERQRLEQIGFVWSVRQAGKKAILCSFFTQKGWDAPEWYH